MKLTQKTEYALATLMELAEQRTNGVVRVPELAARKGIPRQFLAQILLALKKAGIVRSRRGAHGGYELALLPREITLSAVLGLTEDSLLHAQSERRGRHERSSVSILEDVWQDINRYVREKLDRITIQDLCDRLDKIRAGTGDNFVI